MVEWFNKADLLCDENYFTIFDDDELVYKLEDQHNSRHFTIILDHLESIGFNSCEVVSRDVHRSIEFIKGWKNAGKYDKWTCFEVGQNLVFMFRSPKDKLLFKLMW